MFEHPLEEAISTHRHLRELLGTAVELRGHLEIPQGRDRLCGVRPFAGHFDAER